jgi:hypothetical protein
MTPFSATGNDSLDTPGAKKRKAGEMDGNFQMDGNGLMEGITPIPGMNYVEAAKKNNQQMLQSQFFHQQQLQQQQHQQQQQQRGNQNQQNRSNQQGRRRASALVFGNVKAGNMKDGKDETENCLLTADVNLVASGVSKDATPEQLKEFIVSKGINVTEIELLANHKVEARSFSYRIAIKPADYEKALKPDVWPYRVGVRLYKPKSRVEKTWKLGKLVSGTHVCFQEPTGCNIQESMRLSSNTSKTDKIGS